MSEKKKICPACMNETEDTKICSICGHDFLSNNPTGCLPIGYVLLGRYVIGKALDFTSDGIVYIAWDNGKNAAVSVKEYFPIDIAGRNSDKTVSYSDEKAFGFNEGLIEFLDLNRKLMKVEAPSLLLYEDVFEENNTAYAVFAQAVGVTLSDFLERNGGTLKWEQARPLFLPLIDTVIALNENGIIHGGISPESIIVGRDGKIRITNISIIGTRYFSGVFATALYPGCAAAEQYSSDKNSIGSYTDVYGISASMFRTLIGVMPPPANDRAVKDSMSIPSHFADELPRQVLVALANGLQLKVADRTNSVEKFRDELVYGETKENIQKAEAKRQRTQIEEKKRIDSKFEDSSNKKSGSSAKYVAISAGCTALFFIIVATILCLTVFKDNIFPKKDNNSSDNQSLESYSSIGDVEEGADVVDKKLYKVPDLVGKYYTEIDEDENNEYENFVIKIVSKQYSDTAPRGTVCTQSVPSGKEVERNTAIEIVISLGPEKIKVADVTGLKLDEAKIELLKQGFLYDNISVVEKYDPDSEPETIVDQSPKYGESVNTETAVTIYINSYKEEKESE